MKKIIVLIIMILTLTVSGQNREEIISVMDKYAENFEKLDDDFNFIENKLEPAILKVKKLTCENNDFELFDNFIEMVLKIREEESGYSNEAIFKILTCKPKFVEKRLTEKYKDEFLVMPLILEYQFALEEEEELENNLELKESMKRLQEWVMDLD